MKGMLDMRIKYTSSIIIIILVLVFLAGCSREEENGPGKVRWDREVCARCAMAISDRNYSAQIRGGRPDRETKLYKFDDIGCAIIWLNKQNWKNDPRTKIWVNDHRNGNWLDAKTAWYVKARNTPMDYGLGAQSDQLPGTLNFTEATVHINKEEQRLDSHHGQPQSTPPSIPLLEEENLTQ